MEAESILKAPQGASVGEPAGIDSFYTLEENHGAKRYRSPFYCKMFSKGGRKEYLDSLEYRYLSLVDCIFFERESPPVRREIFLWELEDLIDELRGLTVSQEYLREILETKGSPGNPIYERVLAMIESPRQRRKESRYTGSTFVLKLVGGVALVIVAFYLHFRFIPFN